MFLYKTKIFILGQTILIFPFAGPPAWYCFQIEIKISHTHTHSHKKNMRYIRSHLHRAWDIIYKFVYTSLTYENKNTLLLRNSRKSKVIGIYFHCRFLLQALDIDAIEMRPYKLTFKGTSNKLCLRLQIGLLSLALQFRKTHRFPLI